jgi:hypothetical protein
MNSSGIHWGISLFLLYINDLSNSSLLETLLFANDTTVYDSNKDLDVLVNCINVELKKKQKQAMRPLLEPSTSLTWSLYSKAQEFYLFSNFHSSSNTYQNFLPIKKTV